MFKQFIQYLCESEQLVDIGKLGTATQSSLSKWSKNNDAQRAVDGTYASQYVFHTDEEEYPWWKIKFDQAYDIRHIIINNRKNKKLNAIASSIQVFGIKEGGERIVIHEGDLTFGSLPESMPLILPLYNSQKLIGVEIKLPRKDYLHLHTVNILAKLLEVQQSKNQLSFYSTRVDGLGERLKGLLNIIILAKLTNGRFYCTWEQRGDSFDAFHCVKDMHKVFNDKFIEDYIVEKDSVDNLVLKPLTEVKNLNLEKLKTYDGLLVQQGYILRKIQNLGFSSEKFGYKLAYQEIGFSSHILMAKKLAEKVTLKNKTVAIHLRAGDIVYGIHRYSTNFNSKVVPLYVLEFLFHKLRNEGFEILIFGQDDSLCKGLSREFGVTYSKDENDPDFDDTQTAIFDITLMSRSDLIISGASGFSTLSSWIGDVPQKYHKDLLNEEEIVKAFKKTMLPNGILNREYVSPLMKAYSIMHFLDEYDNNLDIDYKIKSIEQCISLDKNNSFYQLVRALYYFQNKDFIKAESVLTNEYKSRHSYNLSKLLESKRLSVYMDKLRVYAAQGSAVAALVLLSYESRHENTLDIKFYQNIVSNPLEGSLGIEVLKDKLNQLI